MMTLLRKTALLLFVFGLIASCAEKTKVKTVTIKNTLDLDRKHESVELTKDFLNVEDLSTVGIKDTKTQKLQVTQTIDQDGDGSLDLIIFQPEVAANSEVSYEIVTITEAEQPVAEDLCYSRFVPERTDDYTWENDRVHKNYLMQKIPTVRFQVV